MKQEEGLKAPEELLEAPDQAAAEADPRMMQMVAAVPAAPLVKMEAMERAVGPMAAACSLAAGIVAQQLTAAHERELERQEQRFQKEQAAAERRFEAERSLAVRLAKAEAENEMLRKQNATLLEQRLLPPTSMPSLAAAEVKEEEADQEDLAEMCYKEFHMSQHSPLRVGEVFLHAAYAQVDDGPMLPAALEKQVQQLHGQKSPCAALPTGAEELLDLKAPEQLPNYLQLSTLESLDVEAQAAFRNMLSRLHLKVLVFSDCSFLAVFSECFLSECFL